MNFKTNFLAATSLLVLASLFSCKPNVPASWQKFMDCATNNCVAEVVAVKDDFLKDPKPIFEEFVKTDERGEDHFIGWLYILRDSVLVNSKYGTTEERFAMQQAIVEKAKAYENDPKYGSFAKSMMDEIGNIAIASEGEDDIVALQAIMGTYTYELPNEGGSGELKINPSEDLSQVRYELTVVGPPPAYNQGMMEGTVPLEGMVVKIGTDQFGGKCTIELTFSDGQVVAKTLEGDSPKCGFGNNVMADGTYKLVDDLNPFRYEGGDEVPTTLEGNWVSTTDPKSELSIGNHKYIEIYEDKEMSTSPMRYFKVCPADCNPAGKTPCIQLVGQDIVCYALVKNTSKSLELSQIGGTGNTLVFKAKG